MQNSLNEIISNYKTKINSLDRDLKEGSLLFVFAIALLLSSSFLSYYVSTYWVLAIFLDILIYSFLYIGKFSYRINNFISIGEGSVFETNSLLLRSVRIFLYGLLVQIIFYSHLISFFNIMMAAFSIIFLIYFSFSKYTEINKAFDKENFLIKYESFFKVAIVVSALVVLGLMMRFYVVYSISGWDEGWYADITARMFQTQNWFVPLYFDDGSQTLKLFDKPPLMFILGSIWMGLFGYTSLAAKFSMGFFSGLMGLTGYLIFSHQKRTDKSEFITSLERIKKEENEYSQNFNDREEDLKTSDGKLTGIIFGLSMSVTWFLIFYARTAYLDAAIVAFTAFTALFAIKAIDHWFYGNKKRAYLYIFLTAVVNALDLLAKAWQGLIVGPAIAIYLFFRYYEYFIPRQNLYKFKLNILSSLRKSSTFANAMGIIGGLITILTFSNYIPLPDNTQTICTTEFLKNATNSTCITFVPNLPASIFNFSFDLWSVFVAIFVFYAISSITNLFLTNILKDSDSEESNSLKSVFKSYNYIIYAGLILVSILNGFLASFIGATGFQFFYTRFYKVFTQLFQLYITFDSNIANQVFYGELVNGFVALLFSGFILVLLIWIINLIVAAVLELLSLTFLRLRIFYDNFITNTVLEWSLLMPLMIFGVSIGFWAYFLLFQGNFFNRQWQELWPFGFILSIFTFLVSEGYVYFLGPKIINRLNEDGEVINFVNWKKSMSKFLGFLTVTTILIISSFIPFLAWIQYMDQYIVNNPYIIRIPGELAGSGLGEIPSYTWLFFDYYISWRFVGPGSAYTVISSLGGLISPLFLATLPFFITGIYGYIKKRDYANLFFYSSWFFIVLLTFIPASFQLNYYYLAIFFPYFGITSYGIFWTIRKTPSTLNFRDSKEKMILGVPIMILIFLSTVFIPLVNSLLFLQDSYYFNLLLVSSIFVLGGFLVLLIFSVRSIPEVFSLAFIVFYLYRNLIGVGLGNTDSYFLIVSAVLIGMIIFTTRDRMPKGSALFLFIIILTPVTTTAWWVHYKSQDDDQFQQIGEFIISHGGKYNGSTWVFPDAGARYAMRYYLQGTHLINDFDSNYPFYLNSSSLMEQYMSSHPNLKFFVVTNQTYGNSQLPTSAYTKPYEWLKTHFVLVDSLIHKVSWQRVHFFVNASVLTQSDIAALGI